jgi:hypothetical protein
MRWGKTTLRNSFFGWLAPTPEPMHSDDIATQVEEIRHAMLLCLSDTGKPRELALGRKLRTTDDIQTLWFARSDLMQSMAANHGETRARDQMAIITKMFNGLISESITAHKSRY